MNIQQLHLRMETRKVEARKLLKDRRFWLASFLIAWAAGLQGHMMWLQRQDSFKHKFGELKPDSDSHEAADKQSSKTTLQNPKYKAPQSSFKA